MRPGHIKAYSLGIITGAFLTAGLLAAVPAKADGFLDEDEQAFVEDYHWAVCHTIDEYHSTQGVLGVAEAITDEGFAPDSAVDIINASVQAYCPRNWALLQAIGRAARAGTL